MAPNDRFVLPDHIKPLNYDISLFNLELQDPWTFDGLVKIDVEVLKSTKDVVLNAKKLEFSHATVGEMKSTSISYNDEEQRATITFPEAIPESKATIEIPFKGVLNDNLAGFYRAKYKPTVEPAAGTAKDKDGDAYMFSTQFQACDARQAFPCFDEPNLKATYDIALEIPEDQVALSNMPVKSTVPGKKAGTKLVSFERSPPMSTYLAAWAFGDFEYIEAFTARSYNGSPIPVRIYTTRGNAEQGRFSLENSCKVIDLFSETFGLDYPLPKADMLAVESFATGAMENWGLITYRTIALLYDPTKSDPKYKTRVTYVVAHELAHQWFGNLVTMDWWDELWLNESFATWVGTWAVDKLYPEWNYWDEFLSEQVAGAYNLDSLRASHPIHVTVKDAPDVDQIFDAISYNKGSSIIHMITDFVGIDAFFKGVGNYLKAKTYGNAVSTDLWAALGEASGKDIVSFVDPWIEKTGFPFVTIAEEPGQIAVKQNRFLISGDASPEEDETLWPIPLNLQIGTAATTSSGVNLLSSREETIRDVDDSFYLINAGRMGFYRANYPPERLSKLGHARALLGALDKIGLIGDAAAMATAGYGTTAGLLSLLEGFQDETHYQTWGTIDSAVEKPRAIFCKNETISKALDKFSLKLISPALERLGTEFKENEGLPDTLLRTLLLLWASDAGHQMVTTTALDKFAKWQAGDKAAIDQNSRQYVLKTIAVTGGEAAWNALKAAYLAESDAPTKIGYLMALGATKEPELGLKYLEMILTDEVKTQDMIWGIRAFKSNLKLRDLFWEFTKKRWDVIQERFGGNFVILNRWIRIGFAIYSDSHILEDMKAFFADKDCRGFDQGLNVVFDRISANIAYRERDEKVLQEWLEVHGYV